MTERRLEYVLKNIYKQINKVMEKTIPKFTPSGKNAPEKWFNEKLGNMRNRLSKAKRQYKRKPSERNFQNYIEISNN